MYDSHEIASQYVSACGKLFRRSLFENVRFPVGRLFEDEFTTYRLYYKARRIMLYNNPLYFYFVNENGITRNLTLQKYFDEFDAQWERILFYKEKNLETLYHKAILYFLESTKWNLISCRKKTENYDIERGKNFEQQYAEAFRLAKKEKILNFIDHYDYFVLGNPKAVLYYRIKRLLLRHL